MDLCHRHMEEYELHRETTSARDPHLVERDTDHLFLTGSDMVAGGSPSRSRYAVSTFLLVIYIAIFGSVRGGLSTARPHRLSHER